MVRNRIGILVVLVVATATLGPAQLDFAITNGSMYPTGAPIGGWNGFNGTITHQAAIDSPSDPNVGSGSLRFEFTAVSGSVTQDTTLTATGQTLKGFSMDIAHDGSFTALVVGFYEANTWDTYAAHAVNVIVPPLSIPADTDGTLNSFTTVTLPQFTFPSNSNPIYLFIGTSSSISGYAGANVGSKFAIDNVRLATASEVADWTLFD